MEFSTSLRCVRARERVLVNLLNPLDPDAVVADVEVVQYVRGLVLPEDFVDVQQALQDAGLPWAEEHAREMEKRCYFCSVLGLTMRSSCWRAQRASRLAVIVPYIKATGSEGECERAAEKVDPYGSDFLGKKQLR